MSIDAEVRNTDNSLTMMYASLEVYVKHLYLTDHKTLPLVILPVGLVALDFWLPVGLVALDFWLPVELVDLDIPDFSYTSEYYYWTFAIPYLYK